MGICGSNNKKEEAEEEEGGCGSIGSLIVITDMKIPTGKMAALWVTQILRLLQMHYLTSLLRADRHNCEAVAE